MEWSNTVPDGWKIKRLRFIAKLNPSKSEVNTLDLDTPVSFLPMENVYADGHFSLEETRPIEEVYQGFTYFRDGDVIVAKITPCFENGKGAIMKNLQNGVGFGSTEFHVLRPHPNYSAHYLYYITYSHLFRIQGEAMMIGSAGQKRIPEDFLANFTLPFPSFEEQERIADFLDQKTKQVDNLISLKEKQIDALKRKRQALISCAVTQGLDESVEKVASGIEWLGNVPKHWKVLPLKRFVISMCDGPFGSDMKSSHYSNEGVRLIRLQNISTGYFNDNDKAYIPEEHFQNLPGHDVEPGDLLVAGLGDANHPVGRACIYPKHLQTAMVKADCFCIRLNKKKLLHEYAAIYLSSNVAQATISEQIRGATRERINLSGTSQVLTVVPPLNEQLNIIEHIKIESSQINQLMATMQKQVEQLMMWRQAVISAAVTGKLRVDTSTA